jgi:restriction system protein
MAVWVLKGGREDVRTDRFLEHDVVGIGWGEVGDLAAYPDRASLRREYRALHPAEPDGHVGAEVGQLWAFGRRMAVGDIVLVPIREFREIAYGEVTGEYEWTDRFGADMPHVRAVQWIATDLPRDAFDPDLRYSMGSGLTLCAVTRNNAERRIRALLDR